MIIYLQKFHSDKSIKDIRDNFLDYVFMDYLGIPYKNLNITRNSFGKPKLKDYPNIKFNLSHCDGLIACGIGKVDIGIDVELIREFDSYVAKRVCTEKELDIIYNSEYPEKTFFYYWTLKESVGKMLGVGLNYQLKKIYLYEDKNEGYIRDRKFTNHVYKIFDKYLLSISTLG